jgi:AraC-like DNA-binding protein
MTVNGRCTISAGMLMILSPAFPLFEIARSADYQSVILQDSLESILPVFAKNLPSAANILSITPYMSLNDEQQTHFLQSVERIHEKELELRDLTHPVQQKIQTSVITLLRQATLLEYALLFSGQLLYQPQPISHKRQIMMMFLLTLNTEYRQHRTVQYYAEKQNLSPRHFADIIKQESGYTPMEWINMVTINQAKNLLRQPDTQVKDVAAQLGFPEQFTFRKYFKTHTGMSPTEYQRI